jgi:anti-anti-sigma regulatory factor
VLKIVAVKPPTEGTVLHLEGQIIGPWVEELRRTCDGLTENGAITLDLAQVSFVERRGLELLRALAMRGVRLRHCSAFVAEQLKAST